MQTKNIDPPIRLTGRNVFVTPAMEDHFRRKINGLHMDYPRIRQIHGILSVEKYRHRANITLRCNWRIVIRVSSETDDMYKSIDEAVDRTGRKMRKYHTRLLSAGLSRRHSMHRSARFPRGLGQ